MYAEPVLVAMLCNEDFQRQTGCNVVRARNETLLEISALQKTSSIVHAY